MRYFVVHVGRVSCLLPSFEGHGALVNSHALWHYTAYPFMWPLKPQQLTDTHTHTHTYCTHRQAHTDTKTHIHTQTHTLTKHAAVSSATIVRWYTDCRSWSVTPSGDTFCWMVALWEGGITHKSYSNQYKLVMCKCICHKGTWGAHNSRVAVTIILEYTVAFDVQYSRHNVLYICFAGYQWGRMHWLASRVT